MVRIAGILVVLTWLTSAATAAEPAMVRVCLVKFGSVAWEVETVRRQGFDSQANLRIGVTELANPAACEVALLAGEVDAIFTDWIWVARQRNAGQKVVFAPHNAHLGDLMVPAASSARGLEDLDARRIGVAGGPNDKNWLLLRLYARRSMGRELAQPVFAAPPLLSEELESGRLDAALTYWPFAARLAVKGYRPLLPMSQLISTLGLQPPVPMLGFAISEQWMARFPGVMSRFLEVMGKADVVLGGSGGASDEAWAALRPLTGAENDAVLAALRERFRQGIVPRWNNPSAAWQAAKLSLLFAEVGGNEMGIGVIPAGTFWSGGAP
jgi:NitT/TauT family transport system substrate-binding protein